MLPALAVADALTERGVHVTFAGSPDRVEARLVPEAGYELDTFRITRLPAPAVARARARAAARRRARRAPAGAILRARRPDVVLGGGGFVAGPMVFAASTMRIPAALTEADAHLGLANRLAAPFARRALPRVSARDAGTGRRSRVVGRPIPARSQAVPQAEAREIFELPQDGPRARRRSARSPARKSLNEFVVETWGASGPAILHITGRRDFELVRRRVQRDDYRVIAGDRPLRRRALGRRPRARALGLERLGDRRRRPPGDPRAVPVRDRRPPGARTPSTSSEAGGAIMVRELDLDDVPELVRSLLDDPARLERDGRGDARAPRGRTRPSEIADELVALARDDRAGRLWFVGIGGAGLSAYAQLARAWGAEVGGWDRVRTPYLEPLGDVRDRDLARAGRARGLGGGRLVGVPAGARACGARSSCASSSPARAVDRRRRHARQGDDGRR